jgi:hypothetical protein
LDGLMPEPELDLLTVRRGSVTAPAGCGKTQLIADSLRVQGTSKLALVLTHTNAGKAALQKRLQRASVAPDAYRVATIDGWAMRLIAAFPGRSGHDPNILKLENPRTDYPAIRLAAWHLLAAGHLNDALQATYSRLIVDEYQDCSEAQHGIVDWAATAVPTCVLGDPMQAIFGFGGNQLVDWPTTVLRQFPSVGQLQTPWRWRNAGTERLGHWLLAARASLEAGQGVDLRNAPPEVTWVQLDSANAHQRRLVAATTRSGRADGDVLIIGDSTNRRSQQQVASQTPGATTVEAVDLADLTDFGRSFDLSAHDALDRLVTFGCQLMTNAAGPELLRRVESLLQGTARKEASTAEAAAMAFKTAPTLPSAAIAITELSRQLDVRVYRPEVMRACLSALEIASSQGCSLHAATVQVRERYRHRGRPVSRRAVGSTLLLKGLEADVVVVLNPESMDARHLYVALTRGATRVVVCSQTSVLGPILVT